MLSRDSAGDVRMYVGENPRKIKNIVSIQKPSLDAMYLPVLTDKFNKFVHVQPGGMIEVCDV